MVVEQDERREERSPRRSAFGKMAFVEDAMPNVETILRQHVTLNLDCIDRLVPEWLRPGATAAGEPLVVLA